MELKEFLTYSLVDKKSKKKVSHLPMLQLKRVKSEYMLKEQRCQHQNGRAFC
jgi:hypothetical protein